jgi:hypothetical protein
MSEDSRMAIFVAAGFALAFFGPANEKAEGPSSLHLQIDETLR